MSFPIPTLRSLLQRARNSFRSNLPGTDAWIWPSNIYVVAKVVGGLVYMVFERLQWIDKQRFVSTATDLNQLQLAGAELGINLKGASAAQGHVNVTANYPFTVPIGTQFLRSDGVIYAATLSVSATQYSVLPYVAVPVVCTTTGAVGNALAGTPLSTSLANTDGSTLAPVVDANGLGSGADTETFESLQTRILLRKRQPPAGGSPTDYQRWALEVPGVTRAYVAGKAFGPGTVAVWFFMDDTYPSGIPQASDVAVVQAHINSLAPVAAEVFVQAPIARCIDVIVNGLYPDTQQGRQAVAAEVQAVFLKMTQPGLPGQPFVLRWSWLQQAVSNATGGQFNEGVAQPSADMFFIAGEAPCLRSITFT